MNTLPRLLDKLTSQSKQFRAWSAIATRQTGKSAMKQLKEIWEVKSMGGQCGLSDYYWYRLYDDSFLYGRGRQDFLGWRLQNNFSLALNSRQAVLPAVDKLVFSQLAKKAGLPIAPLRAFFHSDSQSTCLDCEHLPNIDAARDFLRNTSHYPIFGKPAFSQQGLGATYLANYDKHTDHIELLGGRTISLPEFLIRLHTSLDGRYHKPERGYLFQSPLKSAPEISAFTQWSAICGVRVVCLNDPGGVIPIRAIWKLATAPNHTDHFREGKYGNLVGNINLDSGAVDRLIGAFWPEAAVLSRHPTSGKPLADFRLPYWSELVEACRRAGPVFPMMKIHHWDFAITDDGPIMLELNDQGGTKIPQLHGRGLLTTQTREFLQRHSDASIFPWIATL